jgi:SNF family Na+-dependent transporter
MRRLELTIWRVLLIYLLGLIAGVQAALYLYDTFDDGVSDPLSGAIALLFVAAGLGAIAWSYRRNRAT